MAYYYVKLGGTATADGGRSATKRTGTWNADPTTYYNDVKDVYTTSTTKPTVGDFIFASHLHSYILTATYIDWKIADGVMVISVDDANQENYKKGANEGTTGSQSVYLNSLGGSGYLGCAGFVIDCGGTQLYVDNRADDSYYLYDCTLNLNGSSTQMYGPTYGSIVLQDCDIVGASGNTGIYVNNGSHWTLTGGSMSGMFRWNSGGFDSGGVLLAKGVDFSGMLGGVTQFVNQMSAFGASIITLENCNFADDTHYFLNHGAGRGGPCTGNFNSVPILPVVGLTLPTHDTYWYQWTEGMLGWSETVTDIYRNATYDGSNPFSHELDGVECRIAAPYRFKLMVLPAQDLVSADKTYTVHFDSPTAGLKNDQCWIEIIRPHVGASAALSFNELGVFQSGRSTDILNGSAHTAGSGWTGGTNPYKQSITVSSDANQLDNAAIEIWFCMSDETLTINVDPAVDIT